MAKTVVPRPVQVVPFVLVAIVFPLELRHIPTATHKLFAYATPNPYLSKIVVPYPVHVVPLVLDAMLFTPEPTATHKLFPYATPYPC